MTTSQLSQEHRRTLAAASARILPSDDGPGALEAHAIDAIEKALQHRFFSALRPWMERGIELLRSQARERYEKEFSACEPQEQDAVLREIQDDPHFATRMFFDTLIGLSLEGFLGDPVHGGNRDFVGWQYIGCGSAAPRSGFCLQESQAPTRQP